MVAKLNFKQISIAYTGASFASVTCGAVIAGLWDTLGGDPNYSLMIGGTWLVVVGLPSMAVASDSLLKSLGRRSPITISTRGGHSQGRKVPINYREGQSHLFLSALPRLKHHDKTDLMVEADPIPTVEIPQIFTVDMDGFCYEVPITDLRDFLYKAWARQRVGKPGFSRNYWMKDHRPKKLDRQQYDAMIAILSSVNGLLLNRDQRRSGRLALPPEATIRAIQGQL